MGGGGTQVVTRGHWGRRAMQPLMQREIETRMTYFNNFGGGLKGIINSFFIHFYAITRDSI